MTEQKNRIQSESEPLLSDDNFVALIEAEYVNSHISEDKAEKEIAWQKIENRLFRTKFAGWRQYIPLATAAMIVIVITPLLIRFTDQDTMRTKGISQLTNVNLSVYEVSHTGELGVSDGIHSIGSTLVFKLDASIAAHYALLLAKGSHNPQVRFKGQVPPGSGQLIEQSQQTYGYQIDPTDTSLRFCVIAATTKSALEERLEILNRVWGDLLEPSCVNVKIIGS